MRSPARLLLLLTWLAGCGAAFAQTPPAAGTAVASPEAMLKAVEQHLAAGRFEDAVKGLRELLLRKPDDHDLRLRLAGLLMDRQRYAEALPEIQRVRAARPDVAVYTSWLRALDAVGTPLDRALAAEEAAARHAGHVPFLWAATEALVALGLQERAQGYWRKLSKADQATPRGQYLLGAMHEAAGRLSEALAAYRAARDEARAQAALTRLRGRALNLGGALYFPPAPWSLLPGEPARLTDPRAGHVATPYWLARSKPPEALRKILGQRLPLPADDPLEQALSGKRKPGRETATPEPLSIEPLACPGQRPMQCVEAGPGKAFAGLLPRLHAGAIDLRAGTLVVVLEGAGQAEAARALRVLGDAPLLPEGGQP